MIEVLGKKIGKKSAHVAVIGLGYVGLPLAVEFAKAGFKTTGVDISKERVRSIQAGRSYIDDISHDDLAEVKRTIRLAATGDFRVLKSADAVVICVPTPLGKTRQPDLSYVMAAVEEVAKQLRKEQVVVLESTTYPGTTDENILPRLEKGGLKAERDFFLGFSPERVDPANKRFAIRDIPKVIGGVGPLSTRLIGKLYGTVFRQIVPVSSSKTAEMVKLLENTFRSINIGLINEMAMVCNTLDIDVWEVIEAAKTKPFGFMPFYPGPGIGGHCINIDPMYLAWKARLHGYEPRLIELAQTINDEMPHLIVKRASRILNGIRKPLRGSKVLIIGMAYKKNVRDIRESPSLFIMQDLEKEGAVLTYHDPHVPSAKPDGKTYRSQKLTRALLDRQDLVLVLTDHDAVNWGLVAAAKAPVFDTRNVFKSRKGATGKFHKL